MSYKHLKRLIHTLEFRLVPRSSDAPHASEALILNDDIYDGLALSQIKKKSSINRGSHIPVPTACTTKMKATIATLVEKEGAGKGPRPRFTSRRNAFIIRLAVTGFLYLKWDFSYIWGCCRASLFLLAPYLATPGTTLHGHYGPNYRWSRQRSFLRYEDHWTRRCPQYETMGNTKSTRWSHHVVEKRLLVKFSGVKTCSDDHA